MSLNPSLIPSLISKNPYGELAPHENVDNLDRHGFRLEPITSVSNRHFQQVQQNPAPNPAPNPVANPVANPAPRVAAVAPVPPVIVPKQAPSEPTAVIDPAPKVAAVAPVPATAVLKERPPVPRLLEIFDKPVLMTTAVPPVIVPKQAPSEPTAVIDPAPKVAAVEPVPATAVLKERPPVPRLPAIIDEPVLMTATVAPAIDPKKALSEPTAVIDPAPKVAAVAPVPSIAVSKERPPVPRLPAIIDEPVLMTTAVPPAIVPKKALSETTTVIDPAPKVAAVAPVPATAVSKERPSILRLLEVVDESVLMTLSVPPVIVPKQAPSELTDLIDPAPKAAVVAPVPPAAVSKQGPLIPRLPAIIDESVGSVTMATSSSIEQVLSTPISIPPSNPSNQSSTQREGLSHNHQNILEQPTRLRGKFWSKMRSDTAQSLADRAGIVVSPRLETSALEPIPVNRGNCSSDRQPIEMLERYYFLSQDAFRRKAIMHTYADQNLSLDQVNELKELINQLEINHTQRSSLLGALESYTVTTDYDAQKCALQEFRALLLQITEGQRAIISQLEPIKLPQVNTGVQVFNFIVTAVHEVALFLNLASAIHRVIQMPAATEFQAQQEKALLCEASIDYDPNIPEKAGTVDKKTGLITDSQGNCIGIEMKKGHSIWRYYYGQDKSWKRHQGVWVPAEGKLLWLDLPQKTDPDKLP